MGLLHYVTLLALNIAMYLVPAKSQLEISVTAPINPVDEGGILSIHCQVWNLQKGQDVTMVRTVAGEPERLSMNEDVLGSADDRVFVASRSMNDGSTVYFLSIIDVTKDDNGLYECSVLSTTGRSEDLPSGSEFVEITYFPSESDPVCSYGGDFEVEEGEMIEMNCSSELALPAVSLNWERNGETISAYPTEEIYDGRIHSSVRFAATRKDSNAVFICKISSVSFPDRPQTCHIGPLKVYSDSDSFDSDFPLIDTEISQSSVVIDPDQTPNSEVDIWNNPNLSEECQTLCMETSSPALYWVLATIVAAVLAIVFLLVCVSVFLKYNAMKRANHGPYYLPGQLTAEEIYSEVEHKRDNRVYMALDKREFNHNLDCHNYIATTVRKL